MWAYGPLTHTQHIHSPTWCATFFEIDMITLSSKGTFMSYIFAYIFLGVDAALSLLIDSISASQYAGGHEVVFLIRLHLNKKTASLF
jgi:hypothetical protein